MKIKTIAWLGVSTVICVTVIIGIMTRLSYIDDLSQTPYISLENVKYEPLPDINNVFYDSHITDYK